MWNHLETMAKNWQGPGKSSRYDPQQELESLIKLEIPTFDGTNQDPTAAKDWLYEVKEKLDLAGYSEGESVQLAFRHLKGIALAW